MYVRLSSLTSTRRELEDDALRFQDKSDLACLAFDGKASMGGRVGVAGVAEVDRGGGGESEGEGLHAASEFGTIGGTEIAQRSAMTTTIFPMNLPGPPDAAPRLDHLSGQKRKIDDAAEDYAHEVQGVARALLGSVKHFDEGICCLLSDIANGKAAEVQGIREEFLDMFQRQLSRLRKAADLARHASRVTGRELPEVSPLDGEVGDLGLRLLSLSILWQTVDDLATLTEAAVRRRSMPLDMRRLTPEQRNDVMRRSAEMAEEDYRTNPELLCFEAFGEKDLYDDYPD